VTSNHAVIRKSNSLIEASYKLSVNEQRLILMLASSVKSEDKDFCPYRIAIKDFASLLDLKNKNVYQDVEELVLGLREKTVTIFLKDSVLHTGWLSSIEYFTGEGIIELSFDPKMKPFLLELKERFTSYKLKQVIQLRSSFSIRIYELLKQYERMKERTLELSRLRELLGIEKNQYELYGHFKSRVLLWAQAELAAKTDIAFDFEEIKVGRSVKKIRFIIRPQNQPEAHPLTLPIPNNSGKPDLYESIKDLLEMIPPEFSEKETIRKMILAHVKKSGKDYVTRNIVYANENSNAVKPGSNLEKGSNYRVYLSKTLQNDYGLAYQEDLAGKTELETKRIAAIKEQEQKKQVEESHFEIERENIERAKVYLSSLTPESLAALREESITRLDKQNQELVARKSAAAELIVKISMNKIALERMKLG